MSKGVHTKKEIEEQAESWDFILRKLEEERDRIKEFFKESKFSEAIFFGAGSSYYLGLSAAATFQKMTGVRSHALPSSELLLFPKPLGNKKKTEPILLIPISRSGKTTETVLTLKRLKKLYPAKSLAVSCYSASKLAINSDLSIIAEKAQEKSIVMTKSFTSLLIGLQGIASIYADDEKFLTQLNSLSNYTKENFPSFQRKVKKVTTELQPDKYIYLGGGPLYGIACESMLKMKEMALESSEAYHPLEFRHGPKSIVTPETLIIMFLSDSGFDYEKELMREMKDLGAKILAFSKVINNKINKLSDYTISLPSNLREYQRLPLYLPPVQLLGLETALKKGLNPDKPQHLDQVVEL